MKTSRTKKIRVTKDPNEPFKVIELHETYRHPLHFLSIPSSSRMTAEDKKIEELIFAYNFNHPDREKPFYKAYINPVVKWGVKATRPFKKGEFVLEFKGIDIPREEAEAIERELELRDAKYKELSPYFFFYDLPEGKGTHVMQADPGHISYYLNHSYLRPNLKPKVIFLMNNPGQPRLAFFALVDIPINTELKYNYNENDPVILRQEPWLRNT